jgi:16S rRNA (cytidine1402-2'-O)-methyltransferase
MPLYLIPVTLGDTPHRQVFPDHNRDIILSIHHFMVENVRSARRFLKQVYPLFVIDTLTFYELNKHTPPENIGAFLAPLAHGLSVGLLSEAGCPAIADPGAEVISEAQRRGYRVVPLVGPSSILLALIASGLNGQSFAFNGYLPVDRQARIRSLRHLENIASTAHQTQLFIETPYRNDALATDIIRTCRPNTLLCIATSLTCANESVRTLPIGEWRRIGLPELAHLPTVFLLGV